VIKARLGRTLTRPAITRIHEVSAGNPLYALELARGIDEHLPPGGLTMPESLIDLVRRRLGTVSDETARLLLAAACAATPTVAELAQPTQATAEQVVDLLEIVETQGIITLDGSRVRFAHPLLSHGVYSQASAPQRRAMHRTLAGLTELPELQARHLALAAVSADEATLAAIDTAANAAAARGAPSAAAELLDLAISLGGDNPLWLLRAAEQHFRAGLLDEADRRVQSVIDSVRPGTLRSVALMLRGAVDGYEDRLPQAVDVLTQAVAEAGDNPALRLQGLLLLALAIGVTGDMVACVDCARRAVADADQLDNADLRSQALALWVHVGFMHGLGTDEQALATALTLENHDGTAPATLRARAVAAVNRAWRGDLHQARIELAGFRAAAWTAAMRSTSYGRRDFRRCSTSGWETTSKRLAPPRTPCSVPRRSAAGCRSSTRWIVGPRSPRTAAARTMPVARPSSRSTPAVPTESTSSPGPPRQAWPSWRCRWAITRRPWTPSNLCLPPSTPYTAPRSWWAAFCPMRSRRWWCSGASTMPNPWWRPWSPTAPAWIGHGCWPSALAVA
jgi:hypothetical protein